MTVPASGHAPPPLAFALTRRAWAPITPSFAEPNATPSPPAVARLLRLYATASVAALGFPDTLIVLRSLLGWLGVVLVYGRLFDRCQSWAGPIGLLCVPLHWGDSGWWDFSTRPYDDASSLLLRACLLAIGLPSLTSAPWRLSRLRGALVPARSGSLTGQPGSSQDERASHRQV